METIFDFNPSKQELLAIIGVTTLDDYKNHWLYSKEGCILDIVLLFESRKDEATAKKYRDLIPDLYQQWMLGLDSVQKAI